MFKFNEFSLFSIKREEHNGAIMNVEATLWLGSEEVLWIGPRMDNECASNKRWALMSNPDLIERGGAWVMKTTIAILMGSTQRTSTFFSVFFFFFFSFFFKKIFIKMKWVKIFIFNFNKMKMIKLMNIFLLFSKMIQK